jgi:uncharacterized protein YcbK (DUF882 family)
MLTGWKLETAGPEINRRRFIKLTAASALGVLSPCTALGAIRQLRKRKRSLSFYNTHTGQSLETVYWSDGKYLRRSLGEINEILRDHRTNEIKPIDPKLLDLLCAIRVNIKSKQPFHIISGYRSPKTNARLRKRSGGVARNSFHLLGKAADIRVPGCCLVSLHRAAMGLRVGGVGYYPRSNFVHVDVGPVRSW